MIKLKNIISDFLFLSLTRSLIFIPHMDFNNVASRGQQLGYNFSNKFQNAIKAVKCSVIINNLLWSDGQHVK